MPMAFCKTDGFLQNRTPDPNNGPDAALASGQCWSLLAWHSWEPFLARSFAPPLLRGPRAADLNSPRGTEGGGCVSCGGMLARAAAAARRGALGAARALLLQQQQQQQQQQQRALLVGGARQARCASAAASAEAAEVCWGRGHPVATCGHKGVRRAPRKRARVCATLAALPLVVVHARCWRREGPAARETRTGATQPRSERTCDTTARGSDAPRRRGGREGVLARGGPNSAVAVGVSARSGPLSCRCTLRTQRAGCGVA